MRPSPRRTVAVAALALPLLALPLAACGSEDDGGAIAAPDTTAATGNDPSTTATTAATDGPSTTAAENASIIEVTVEGGQPVGGSQSVDVALGTEVTIRVTADVEDEVHVHGYDLLADVAPGAPTEITFFAEIPGQFEVELEGAGVTLVELTVS